MGRKCIAQNKKIFSLDQLSAKKIALHENGKRRVQLIIPEIVIGGLIGCIQNRFRNCATYEQLRDKIRTREIYQSIEEKSG